MSIFNCVVCNDKFQGGKHSHRIKSHLKTAVCQNCRNKFGKYYTLCTKCNIGFFHNSPTEKFCDICKIDVLYLDCIICGNTYKVRYSGQKYCPSCGKYLTSLNGKRNIIKYNKSEKGRENSAKAGKKTIHNALKYSHDRIGIRYCSKCDRETSHIAGVGCLSCHNNSEVMRKAIINRNLYNWTNPGYKKKIANNLKDYVGRPNFEELDGVLYYKGEVWEDFKKNFTNKPVELENFANRVGGFVQSTYRISPYATTGQDAMERDLVEKGVGYFVWFKFFNDLTPAVVAKSGSKLVNKNGSDVGFSLKNYENCPARRIIVESNNTISWYYDNIVIIPCDNEIEAFNLEKSFQNGVLASYFSS